MSFSQQSSGSAGTNPPRDLSQGVVVVLSGGGFDEMNPAEVRQRMDDYITTLNNDAFVQQASGGQGLTFHLIDGQQTKHLHQTQWRAICEKLNLRQAAPIILVGHSNGGAAAVDLARCLNGQNKLVDLLFTADSVVTLDDNGDVYEVPPNVTLNINTHVIPTPAWFLAPFPFGRSNRRQANGSLDGILNIGLRYNLPGALGHRNAFYDLAGGDKRADGSYSHPFVLLDASLATLHGATNHDTIAAVAASMQTLATQASIRIDLATAEFVRTLHP
jgi:hypothetical protein